MFYKIYNNENKKDLQRSSVRKVVLKIPEILRKNICIRFIF